MAEDETVDGLDVCGVGSQELVVLRRLTFEWALADARRAHDPADWAAFTERLWVALCRGFGWDPRTPTPSPGGSAWTGSMSGWAGQPPRQSSGPGGMAGQG